MRNVTVFTLDDPAGPLQPGDWKLL